MKRLFLFLLVGILFAGCSKDNGGDKPTPAGGSTMSSFSFTEEGNTSISKTATGRIGMLGSDYVIFITVDEDADITSLRPSFKVDQNAIVTYNGSPVTDNSTAIDFSDRVELTVTGENGSTKVYHVLCKKGIEKVDRLVYNFMLKYSIPGISVAVSKDEEIVYSYGYGFADQQAKELTTADHLFRLGSVSKQQTALCIMTLVEEGRLNLSDHVFGEGGILEEEFGTQMPQSAKKVTIQNLLEHNSGWSSDPIDPMFTADPNYDGKPLEEIISYVLANVPQSHTPGNVYDYYNLGFGMLGKVVEKVSGKDFESYLKEDVLSKAGVTEIYVGGDKTQRRENECIYYSQEGTNGYGNDMEMIKAAGGIIASAPALMQLMAHIDYGTKVPDILKKETLDIMYKPSKSYEHYALGWRLNHTVFSNWASYHSGNLAGTAAIWMRGYNGVSAVILCNSRSYLDDSGGSFDDYLYTLLEDVECQF